MRGLDDEEVSFVPVSLRGSTVGILLLACIGLAVMVWLWRAGRQGVIAPPVGGAPLSPVASAPSPSRAEAGAPTPVVTVEATLITPLIAPPQGVGLAASADGSPLRARVVAGVGAGFDAVRGARGSALVSVDVGNGTLLRHLAVDPVQPGEVRVGARVEVRGTVVDARQQPARGAAVWFGELDAAGVERTFDVDEAGAFSADVPAGDGVLCVARGPGLASTWRVVEVGAAPRELRVAMQPASELRVQLAGRALEVERARAFVVPVAGTVSSAVAQWPFFGQLQGDGYPFDAEGRAVIPDLPQDGDVGVVVRHPRAPLAAPVRVTLSEAPQRVTVPISFGEHAVAGTLVDPEGQPVAGAWLFGRVPRRSLGEERSARLLPPFLGLRGGFVARSDERGRFSVGLPGAADAQLSIRAAGFAGQDLHAPPAAALEVRLDAWRGGDASLRVTPPVDDVAWRLAGAGVELACGPGVAGVLALPRCGRYHLRLEVRGGAATSATIELPEVVVTGPVVVPSSR